MMMIWLFFCQGREHFANYPGDKNMSKVTLHTDFLISRWMFIKDGLFIGFSLILFGLRGRAGSYTDIYVFSDWKKRKQKYFFN